jgi:1-deoxy-D-xylulose-5-phosphate synthase
MSKLLERLAFPADLKQIPLPQLDELAREVRTRIIETVAVNGGHFGGPLGVVELAIALHHAFDFPHDRLIWDVGHQVYPHKLLTGRAGRFHTLRTEGGLSGYPAPDESPHDLFTTAHAGTATSLAVGLAAGDTLRQRPSRVVAVVGDGALSSGVAYEALNHAGTLKRQLLIILNDNNLSIDRGVGGLASLLERARAGGGHADPGDPAGRNGRGTREALHHPACGPRDTCPCQVFEALGLRYRGPFDGHDIPFLIELFRTLATVEEPVLLHLHTQKGRGFDVANRDPLGFHALTPFRLVDGKVEKKPSGKASKSYTEVFGDALCEAGERHPELVAITAAMPDGTGLLTFRERFPERFHDVGICEQHAVAFAAGLARAGAKPVAAIYSTFLQRAFDQLFHEVSLQNLPVVVAMDRSGVVGADGPTHHGLADVAYLRLWPNFVVCAPADAAELRACLNFALDCGRPVAFRYPRDEAVPALGNPTEPFRLGKAVTYRTGTDAVLVTYGVMAGEALQAADLLADRGWSVGVVNARFAKPLDEETLGAALEDYPLLVTIEDHFLTGGFGSAVLEFAAERHGPRARIVRLGAPDRFVPHATRRRQLEMLGLTAAQVADRVEQELARTTRRTMTCEPAGPGRKGRATSVTPALGLPQGAELEALLDLGTPLAGSPVGEYLSRALQAPLEDFLAQPGKAVRAQLVRVGFSLARTLKPGPDAADCDGLAECIELIHAGSLIIDDIQDNSRVRRGRPTFHSRHGHAAAINAGNWLYFRGMQRLQTLGLPADTETTCARLLHERLLRAHYGQALDLGVAIDQVPQGDVRELCLASIRLKSGELVALALLLGATAGGASPALLQTLDRFGHQFGMALQMFDDLNNLDPTPAGDPLSLKRLEDLILRRPSWLWAVAATETSTLHYEAFQRAVRWLPDEAPLTAWLAQHGIAERARAAADQLLRQALEEFQTVLPADPAVRDILTKVEGLAARLRGAGREPCRRVAE